MGTDDAVGSSPGTVPGGWRSGPLPGVMLRSLSTHPDDRGSFTELWRASLTDPLDPGAGDGRMRQANLSRSGPNVLRGLHVHRRQADLWLVIEGHPVIALVDIRPALDGSGRPSAVTFDASPGDAIHLPAGVAHGFYARDAMTLIYLVSNEYDGTDELGFRWDDPDAGVPWPMTDPVLSSRDATAPGLMDLIRTLSGDPDHRPMEPA